MKKILIIFVLILFTGCSSKTIDLKKLSDEIIHSSILNEIEETDLESFSKRYNIDISNFDRALVLTSKKFDNAEIVFMVLPKSGKNNTVKKVFDNFIDSYNSQWVDMDYFPEQKELVKKALNTNYNNYLIYIVSNNNSEILKLIKSI